MPDYPQRYPGQRWRLLYGSYEGIERTALNELQRLVQPYLPYVLQVQPAAGVDEPTPDNTILAGTLADHPGLARCLAQAGLTLPTAPESYALACLIDPADAERRTLVVAGQDAKGVLNGVCDLGAHVLPTIVARDDALRQRAAFDNLPPFARSTSPAVARRGLWSWGYVIYDYRRYLDHMARLRMNEIVIWNDVPPINAPEVIAYAHARGIRVILGFHWGWGIADLDPTDPAARRRIKDEVLANYRRHYSCLDLDGIYFQTFTEQSNTLIGARSIASLACEWVNDIARALLAEAPGLGIYFGLHATSIAERYTDLKPLDPRVTIMWEDAGTLPWHYDPLLAFPAEQAAQMHGLETFEPTLAYAKRLRSLRTPGEFAMVAKGWVCLRWESEFEHHGPFILGERPPEFVRQRLAERQPYWDRKNDLWLAHYVHAAHFYRELLALDQGPLTVLGLVEDGLFEERIQPSVALFAETLWDPRRSDGEILRAALSPYYEGRT